MQRLALADCINDVCPLSGRPVVAEALALYRGQVVGFASPASRDEFLAAILMFESARLVPERPRQAPLPRATPAPSCRFG
ncbi:hypothetical protein [Methylobrevis pamukkalensis]|uniref:Uncharacterized protein n=1 Tax=Methylobrevis pamukkalensis TaxID=1439726 RepID=A0A1E3H5V2_9HYPH|nr:hypothetical protein [Methylobrevis pamukkalensis]ODN71693.1 hypothetical protein A6302_00937 [Methylobrevis pamukkalensis]